MTPRQLRLVRGAAASSIATVIAAVSHTIGGGAPPHPLLVIALGVFLTPLAALLVGRTPSIGRLSAAVLVSQTVFHVLFVALGATASATVMTGHHHVMTLDPLSSTVAPDAGMLGAHIAAAALTIAMLWRGERLLSVIRRWVHTVLRTRMPRLHAEWPVPASVGTTARRFVPSIPAVAISRRGPPALSRG
ncbi:hypothetical protein [Microbacterium murale]|uniref:Integral membrane protein n=1 Tax=Microbacterium murale TaxID=1081040 RepID=A0ABQ1RT18_9MICO|nr:hypothetical protein [Microbacterium murale]GGD80847.1 hypothetical protein GCM10007269_24610 [Microbacterium murale]